MSQKILELLQVFRVRASDPAVKGKRALIHETFELAAKELEQAIRESEPENLISYVPIAVIDLVHEACHFNSDSEECWERLGLAAMAIQNGPS